MLRRQSALIDIVSQKAYLMIEYMNPTTQNAMALSREPVKANTRDGDVNMPVPSILLTIKANTSKLARAPATGVCSGGASISMFMFVFIETLGAVAESRGCVSCMLWSSTASAIASRRTAPGPILMCIRSPKIRLGRLRNYEILVWWHNADSWMLEVCKEDKDSGLYDDQREGWKQREWYYGDHLLLRCYCVIMR